ncbi:MAG: MBL fold metallo-hydrolase [Ginsengibacter sp.]
MKIFPLSEGSFTVDQTKQVVPFNTGDDDLETRPKGSILVEIQPFAIVTSKDILVIDTGLGFKGADKKMQIHVSLAKNGINASDVTKVLVSHLHKDHSGGILQEDKKTLAFENAQYYINENEWNFAKEKGLPSFIPEDYSRLGESKQLVLTNESGKIDSYIEYEVTGGHSPYHQVFKIKEGEEIIFFGGDVAPQLQQMKNRFKAKYDFDSTKAMELRNEWWKKGEKENWTFLFYHDIKYPIYSHS